MDNLKNTWKAAGAEKLGQEQLKEMKKERNHPILKGIRVQLMLEAFAWSAFLALYYDAFDGESKPFYANILLITGSLLLIVHNVLGYLAQRNIIKGSSLLQSMQRYLHDLRTYKTVSITTRIVGILALLVFFGSVIEFTQAKYLITGALLLLTAFQVLWLNGVWNRRIRQIDTIVTGLSLE